MINNILYINNKSNEEFGTVVIENLNNKLTFGKMASGKTFVSKLVGQKGDTFIFETLNRNIITNRVCDVVAIREYDPSTHTPKRKTTLPKSTSITTMGTQPNHDKVI